MFMKKIIIGFCFVGLLFASNLLVAEELLKTDPFYYEIETEILAPFFNALRDGDVDVIKEYISKDVYRKNRRLLDQNKEYPEFLRNYYQGASFHTKSVLLQRDTIIVDVEIQMSSGDSLTEELYLVRVQRGLSSKMPIRRVWKIKNLNGVQGMPE